MKKLGISNFKGFTLIELILAVFILTVGIVAIISMFPLATRVGKSSEMTTIATELGQEKLEEIISSSYEEISLGITCEDYGQISGFSSYKRVTEVSCFDPNGDISPNCPDDTGIKKIKVTIFWKLFLGAYNPSVDIVSLVAKR